MNRSLEHRYAIKFCFKLGKIASKIHEMIRSAYGDDAMSRSSVFEWRKLVREGREQVEDDQRSERPSTSKTNENLVKVKNLLSPDRRLSVRMISELFAKNYCARSCDRKLGNEKSVCKIGVEGVDR